MTAGLRRFLDPAPEPPPPPAAARETAARETERCEMCAAPTTADHGHVVDLERRSLLCVCRACRILFVPAPQHAETAASGARYRAVPGRYLEMDPLSPGEWAELDVPVRTAFFFHNSRLGRTVACYPSPGGATESLVADADQILGSRLAAAEPDVEALLVDMRATPTCHLVPIDACYEFVGLLRSHWTGFDGGGAAHEAVDSFFARLARRRPATDGPPMKEPRR